VLVRSLTERGLSERRALAVMGTSASALRYTPAIDEVFPGVATPQMSRARLARQPTEGVGSI